MNVKCNFCEATAKGTKDKLMNEGWSRVVIFTPVRKTITSCPLHQKEAAEKLVEVLPGRFKKETIKEE